MLVSWWRRIILVLALAHSMANNLPKEITRLTQAVKSIPGVTDAALEKTYLPDVDISDLLLPGTYGDLPAATLLGNETRSFHHPIFSATLTIDFVDDL